MHIGDVNLRNEFVMAPIKTGYSDGDGGVTDRHRRFYRRRADHVGAIIPEPLYLDESLREVPTQMGIANDDAVPGLRTLTEAIHEGGAKAIAHLNHPGRMANPGIEGTVHLSASATTCERTGVTPDRMSKEQIDTAIEQFAEGARRAEQAGFDVIELQFGHGYLVAQFFSPAVNDRVDEYGGSFENRTRFGREVFDAVQAAVDVPVMIRLTADDTVEGGIAFREARAFSQELADRGAAAFHVTMGTLCATPPYFFQHMYTPKGDPWEYADALQADLDVPVAAVGRINEFDDVETVREDLDVEMIALGRALVADPDFLGKYLGEVDGPVRPCMACSDGCLGGVKSGDGLGCVINPSVGDPDELRFGTATEPAEYAVVGGGPAGMAAAEVLAERGHDVDLYEAEALGGAFRWAPLPPGKDSLQKGLEYFTEVLERADAIDVTLERATEGDLEDYDGAVVATGSEPLVPPIDGLEAAGYDGAEILDAAAMPTDERVLVIGGGFVGLETADALARAGNEVVVVELLPAVGGNMIDLEKGPLLSRLESEAAVEINRETDLQAIDGDTAIGETDGQERTWTGIDRYVLATGVQSYDPFDHETLSIPTWTVGDAADPGKAEDAIASAYETARSL
ncbi:NADH:flavin oxidoreductase, Old Yellow Enzyme family [Halanaeroarchaeum sp. HSR-CO]|uniref:oxidoreductase n=1 Tax=Halanaeroarchaeum sp. HSR-CO TaxID=2866382 RepID=UPI00217E212D|nr:FAD-dependent oxidoreductase [Halanaeroarchaeum sp. HSR-CO]UWG46427.1 NADH:flavin oxidoreductase, Old Yellow Enzyme family [Halanaeroarchaeum sp. HSR-CO]